MNAAAARPTAARIAVTDEEHDGEDVEHGEARGAFRPSPRVPASGGRVPRTRSPTIIPAGPWCSASTQFAPAGTTPGFTWKPVRCQAFKEGLGLALYQKSSREKS